MKDYVDTMLCFCRYVLISRNKKHQKEDIYDFLSKNKSENLKQMATNLKEGTVSYEVWQIFTPLGDAELEKIRKKTLERIEGEKICHTF